MLTQNSRSKELLDKVYDYLDTIDVAGLSMKELQDFLEVVQKGQFLESFGQVPSYALGGFGGFNTPCVSNVGQGDSGVCGGTGETDTNK